MIAFTWLGDTNLNGKVDGTDYALADTGASEEEGHWWFGDYDHDGAYSDYGLLDTGAASQVVGSIGVFNATPTNIRVQKLWDSVARISWDAPVITSGTLTGYYIWMSIDDGDYHVIAGNESPAENYYDIAAGSAGRYRFRIAARIATNGIGGISAAPNALNVDNPNPNEPGYVDLTADPGGGGGGGPSVYDPPVDWEDPGTPELQAPRDPTGLTANAQESSTSIQVSWTDDSDNESGFIIERSDGDDQSFEEITRVGAGATTFRNSSIDRGLKYYYRVTAFNDAGESLSTEVKDAILKLSVPTALSVSSANRSEVNLDWQDNNLHEYGFIIAYKASDSNTWSTSYIIPENSTGWSMSFASGKTYELKVRAYSYMVESDWSAAVSVTMPTDASTWEQLDTVTANQPGVYVDPVPTHYFSSPTSAGYEYRIAYVSGAVKADDNWYVPVMGFAEYGNNGSTGATPYFFDGKFLGHVYGLTESELAQKITAQGGVIGYLGSGQFTRIGIKDIAYGNSKPGTGWTPGGNGVPTGYYNQLYEREPGPGVSWRLERRPALPAVSIWSIDSEGTEGKTGSGGEITFRITRAGGDQTQPLTVKLHPAAGSAKLTDDYTASPGLTTVTIPANADYVDVVVTAKTDDKVEGNESIALSLKADGSYRVSADQAMGTIKEPSLTIVANPGKSNIATVQEGTPVIPDGDDNPGFWISRGEETEGDLQVQLTISGNAKKVEDYIELPTIVTIPDGEKSVFLSLILTEDLTPEYTESVGVSLQVDRTKHLKLDEINARAAIDIEDDDYFIVGYVNTPDGKIPFTESSEDDLGSTDSGELPVTDVVGDPYLVFGVADGDWLPWVTKDKASYVASGGSASNPSFSDMITAKLQDSYDHSPLVDENGDLIELASAGGGGVNTAPAPEMGLAILEADYGEAWSFTYRPAAHSYVGKQMEDGQVVRTSIFNANLVETHYTGKGKYWDLRYNDDGSIDRVTRRFGNPNPAIEQLRQSDELRAELLQGYFAEAIRQAGDDQERANQIKALGDAVSDLLEATLRSLPGSIVLDAQEALTGNSASRPGIQLTNGDRTVSAANAALPGVIVAMTKLRELARLGNQFESKALEILSKLDNPGIQDAKRLLKCALDTGRVVRRIPDAVIANNVMIEVKNVTSLDRYMKQLKDHIILCRQNQFGWNIPRYRLIVSDKLTTRDFDAKFRSFLEENNQTLKMTIEQFDPATNKLVTLWNYN